MVHVRHHGRDAHALPLLIAAAEWAAWQQPAEYERVKEDMCVSHDRWEPAHVCVSCVCFPLQLSQFRFSSFYLLHFICYEMNHFCASVRVFTSSLPSLFFSLCLSSMVRSSVTHGSSLLSPVSSRPYTLFQFWLRFTDHACAVTESYGLQKDCLNSCHIQSELTYSVPSSHEEATTLVGSEKRCFRICGVFLPFILPIRWTLTPVPLSSQLSGWSWPSYTWIQLNVNVLRKKSPINPLSHTWILRHRWLASDAVIGGKKAHAIPPSQKSLFCSHVKTSVGFKIMMSQEQN